MKKLNTLADTEKRSLTEDERSKWDAMDTDMKSLKSQIERQERSEALAVEMATQADEERRTDDPNPSDPKAEYRNAFGGYLRRGLSALTSEHRSMVEKRGTATQVTTTDTLGGYTVPEMWHNEIVKYMEYHAGIMTAARIIPTAKGGKYHIPIVNDTTNKGSIIAQGVADTVKDVTFGTAELEAYTYTSNVIKISYELLQDSGYPLEAELQTIIGERLGRILNEHLTVGTGTNQPNGVLTASTLGHTGASATAITRQDLIDLMHSVDRSYRMGASVRYMFNDKTLAAIKKLSIGSGDDRPLWATGMTVGAPDTLEGVPYIVNNDMPDIATGEKSILFGDFSKYAIREVKGTTVQRLNERYADERVVGFFGYARYDGEITDNSAIKHLIQA